MTDKSYPMTIPARAICAKLLPHTTAVENVTLIAAALRAAEEAGHARGVRDATRPTTRAGAA